MKSRQDCDAWACSKLNPAGKLPLLPNVGQVARRRTPSIIICPGQSLLILRLQRTPPASVAAMREDGRHARVNEVQAGSLPGITFYSILYARTSITIQMVMPWEQHLKFLPMHPKMVSANCYCNAQIKKKKLHPLSCIKCCLLKFYPKGIIHSYRREEHSGCLELENVNPPSLPGKLWVELWPRRVLPSRKRLAS